MSLGLAGRKKKAPGLMLTPLLDMFTIILIFLLVSFTAEDYEFRLNPDLTPPESTAASIFKPAIDVAITPKAVMVEGESLLALTDGEADAALTDAGLAPTLVEGFGKIYAERFAADDEPAEPVAPGDTELIEEDPAILIVQADKDLTYRTMHLVLNSAREAGFFKYRLAVVRK